MTWKQLDARLHKWFLNFLLKPIAIPLHYSRTNYWLDGRNIIIKHPLQRSISIEIDELDEIGVETTDKGPFIEDIFWVLKHRNEYIRIAQEDPVFKKLMDQFGSLEGFNWESFSEAMSCTDNHYFLCWRRR